MNILNKWLIEFKSEYKYYSDYKDINKQANENMYCYSLSVDNLNVNQIIEFITKHENAYRQLTNEEIKYYCWYDELAGQIRMSAISNCHTKLPFGCKIEITDIKTIANEIIKKESSLYKKNILSVYSK